eukprot:TRINITY_DN72800_c0_g1_i1.p1 TRINITY_DN72800_c0_g1~~TRINITY_DN72800_c0_g1_i1.p1  ORF type:complete len:526 (-),score=96.36 TRINITY_DN72800_c0_g1_i1:247-1824(-)
MAAMIAAELCQPVKQACAQGRPDLAAYAQEVVLLTLAFSLGWYILRPFMRMIRSHAVHTKVSLSGLKAQGFKQSFVASASSEGQQAQLTGTMCDVSAQSKSQPVHRQSAEVQLARGHVQSGRPDLVVELWMQAAAAACWTPGADEQGSLPPPELYTAALAACAKCEDFASAHRLVSSADWPVLAGSVSGQVALLPLARWLARRQELAGAKKCLDTVRRSGGNVDIRTLRALCVASARGGELEVAAEYFSEISNSQGAVPGLRLFSAMVRGFSTNGDAKQAAAYLRRMMAHGLRPDAMLFDTLLEACANQNMFSLAQEILQSMEDLCVNASNATLASQIKLYTTRGEVLKAYQAFEDVPKKHMFQPNAYVYGLLISASIAHDRADLAQDAFVRMIDAGCVPCARTYESLVRVSLKLGEYAKAVSLVDEAMCLQGLQREEAALQQGSRVPAMLDPKVVEEVLTLLGRRHLAKSLGLPLLQRLEAANFEVSQGLVEAMCRAADAEEKTSLASERAERRGRLDRWRKFE